MAGFSAKDIMGDEFRTIVEQVRMFISYFVGGGLDVLVIVEPFKLGNDRMIAKVLVEKDKVKFDGRILTPNRPVTEVTRHGFAGIKVALSKKALPKEMEDVVQSFLENWGNKTMNRKLFECAKDCAKITDNAVFNLSPDGSVLVEIMPDVDGKNSLELVYSNKNKKPALAGFGKVTVKYETIIRLLKVIDKYFDLKKVRTP